MRRSRWTAIGGVVLVAVVAVGCSSDADDHDEDQPLLRIDGPATVDREELENGG